MRRKLWMVVLALVTVFAVVGTGYAVFTAAAFVNVGASAGTVGPLSFSGISISITGPAVIGQSCLVGVGTTHTPDDTLTFGAGQMSKGVFCTLSSTLSNAGTWPGTLGSGISGCQVNGGPASPTNPAAGTFFCGDFEYTDITTSATTILGGGSLTYTAQVGLPSNAPASAAGEIVSFEITIFSAPA